MSEPHSASAEEAVRKCPVIAWRGTAWRFHKRKYPALDPTGSRMAPGRYHRPDNQDLGENGWQALYLALGPETCVGEILRNTPPELMRDLNSYRLSEIEVLLVAVIDCREITSFGISMDDLTGDHNYETTQRIAQSAIHSRAEAILVPSATRLGDNLVVFPDQLHDGSSLEVVGSRDPVLYVDRS